MSPWHLVVAMTLGQGHQANAGSLPVCSNRTINEVVKRVGCTVGDARCWNRSGGFCTEYVERKVGKERAARATRLGGSEEVRRGDIAVFNARAHYAFVERVIADRSGRPLAVDLSEFNYGDCWVDPESLVTDKYKRLNRRAGVTLREVDGGFLRPGPAKGSRSITR